MIAWYDNIPVLSWLILGGKCRHCRSKISLLYPCIELLTALVLSLLYILIPHHYFFAYFIFFSTLIVTIRSDIETMLISDFATTYLAPIGCAMSMYHLLPLSLPASIAGALCGYSFLYIINKIFKYIRHVDGIGQGDFNLLLCIGAFTGIVGCWMSITIGSMLGSLYGLFLLMLSQHNKNLTDYFQNTKIPFGAFLAFGAILFTLMQKQIFYYVITN